MTFTPDGDGTRVQLTHRHSERHTAGAKPRDSGGWSSLLELYSAAAGLKSSEQEFMQ